MPRFFALNAILIVASISSIANAQGVAHPVGEEVDVTTRQGQEIHFFVTGGGEYQFNADIDGGGNFDVARFGAGFGAQTNFNRDFSGAFSLGYDVALYNFESGSLGVTSPMEPWDDIHILTASAIFSYDISDKWDIFGGPIFQSSRESGADFGESIIGGGAFGATYKWDNHLLIGGGLAVMSQLEDDVRVVPIIVIDWTFANDFHLRNTSTSNASTRTGLELVYDLTKEWELAIGGATQFARFRLDDSGPAPGGVGEDKSLPVWFRATYKPSQQLTINGIVGLNTSGELNIENSSGTNIASQNYDAAFFGGVFVSYRF